MFTQIVDVILHVTNSLMLLPQQLMTSSQLLDKACTRFDRLRSFEPAIVFCCWRLDLSFFSFFRRLISEVARSIVTKLCHIYKSLFHHKHGSNITRANSILKKNLTKYVTDCQFFNKFLCKYAEQSIRTLGNAKLNISCKITIGLLRISVVLNSFMKNLLMVKSSEFN